MDKLVLPVEEYVLERVKKSDVAVNLPLQPLYYQEFNQRVLYGLFPLFAEWDNNRLYRLRVIMLEKSLLRQVEFSLEPVEISRILAYGTIKNLNPEDSLKLKICQYLIHWFGDDTISAAVFWGHWQDFVTKINSNCI